MDEQHGGGHCGGGAAVRGWWRNSEGIGLEMELAWHEVVGESGHGYGQQSFDVIHGVREQ